MNSPCVIIKPHGSLHYGAWNVDGRALCFSRSWSMVDQSVRKHGYEPIPLNTRLAKTILDKVAEPRRHTL